MVDTLNLSGLTVDDSGRVFFSGLTSGIDFKQAVDNIIAAKRIPVDTLENRVTENEEQILALQDLRSLLNAFKDSLSSLYGAVSFGNTSNVFAAKQAFATTSRTDGTAPGAAANLVGVSVTNAATAGSHTIEVLRAATAHKVGGGTFSDKTTALGFAGSFDVTGSGGTATIAVQSTDTLQDIRDRLNNANTGTNATNVSASIVQVSVSEFVLVLTDDETGNTITFSNESGGVLNALGISADGGATLSNELQVAQTARFTADGLKDPDRFESNFIVSSATQLSAIAASATYPASFNITVGANTVTVGSIAATDTVSTLVTKINNAITAAGAGNAVFDAGTSASLMADGDGVRLVLTNTSGAAITLTDTNGLLAGLGVDNHLVIERTSNTVSDLFAGITMTLFQAEEGTTIKLDIEQDLSGVKTAVETLVTAYNDLKSFINGQTQVDPATGAKSADAGTLFGSRTIATVESELAQILGSTVSGVSGAFAVLAQIGVSFVDNGTLSDPLLADTLEIDESKLDEALLNNPNDVRRLFAFNFSSSDPRVALLAFTGNTTFNASGYTLNVNFDERYQGDAITNQFVFTELDAETGGPASDGIGAITFADTVASGQAFRYSYDAATENLTLVNLTAGTSETVNVTALIDAVAGSGNNLGAGESVNVAFATLDVTVTLSGDDGFTRGADIADGTLNTSGLATAATMTNGSVTTPTSGIDKLTLDALIAAGAYNQASGLLTLGVTSTSSNEAHFNTAAGIKFSVDGGPVLANISTIDLDDGLAHSIGIYVNDGTSDVLVATLAFNSLKGRSPPGTGSLTIDLGTGLIAETSVEHGETAPMSNYFSISDGSFEIRDGDGTLLGTVNYLASDSITDLANNISTVAGVTATVISDAGTFKLEILSDTNKTLNFVNDTGGVIAALDIDNAGSVLLSANINGPADGSDDGSATVSGNSITVTGQTGAQGLKLFYSGNGDASGIQLDYTVGLGTWLFFALDRLLDSSTGVVATDIAALEDRNEVNQQRIDRMLERLERQRQRLIDRFIALETALARAAQIRQSIQTTFDALMANRR